jgi:hypothetical protein
MRNHYGNEIKANIWQYSNQRLFKSDAKKSKEISIVIISEPNFYESIDFM